MRGIVLLLALFSANAWAWDATVPPISTDSHAVISITGAEANSSFFAKVTPVGNPQQAVFFSPDDYGLPSATRFSIYFESGPGDYSVEIKSDRDSSVQRLSVHNSDARDETDLLPTDVIQSDAPEIVSLARKITATARTDLERSRAIHDWVATNLNYGNYEHSGGAYNYSSALAAFHYGMAVCIGFANLSAALHRAIGLRARVVLGQAYEPDGSDLGGHAWNQVLIDGQWTNEDPTFDSGYLDKKTGQVIKRLTHTYFDGDLSLFAKTHVETGEEMPWTW